MRPSAVTGDSLDTNNSESGTCQLHCGLCITLISIVPSNLSDAISRPGGIYCLCHNQDIYNVELVIVNR